MTSKGGQRRFLLTKTGAAKGCIEWLCSRPGAIYSAQTIVWQLLWTQGHQMEPFASTSASKLPMDELEAAFMGMGCFPAFMESERNALGRCKGGRSNSDSRNAPALAIPADLRLFGIGLVCGSNNCNHVHHFHDMAWHIVMMIGAGRLDPATLKLYSTKAKKFGFSHICGNSMCINTFHLFNETAEINNGRKKCHTSRTRPLCKHDPPCLWYPQKERPSQVTNDVRRPQYATVTSRVLVLRQDSCLQTLDDVNPERHLHHLFIRAIGVPWPESAAVRLKQILRRQDACVTASENISSAS